MATEPNRLLQHLQLAAQAYGDDLPLMPGSAMPRVAAAPVAAAAPPLPIEPAPIVPPPAVTPIAVPAAPPRPTAQETSAAETALAALRAEVSPCVRCKLCKTRTNTVFGEGAANARVMFVGEAPGAQEDLAGRPFVGPAGQLLDRILANAMGLDRSEVFIANVNKCRPPGNRDPEPDEVAACLPFLRRQIEIVRPEVIVCLGRIAAHNLLASTASVSSLRRQKLELDGIPVVVTWHPAYLLRDPSHKRETWDDIKRTNVLLGRPEVPPSAGA